MNWTGTRNLDISSDLKDVLFKGLAPDGGLFMPDNFPKKDITGKGSLQETAVELMRLYFSPDIPNNHLEAIAHEALTFPIPVKKLDDTLYVLELFHGPTLAFKDVGARIMAGLLGFYAESDAPLTILAATSGDTGSAVASAFLGKPQFRVVLLFPEGKVSEIQRQQLTTFGDNVTALEIKGTFDDCQRLVKQAFNDTELRSEKNLTSANSINIGRWLPQAIYYVHAWNQMREIMPNNRALVSVPSGNLGNVAAGLVAFRHGARFRKLIAACNANRTFSDYIESGKYRPRSSVRTVSNAMDVGDPSNYERIHAMYEGDVVSIRKRVGASSHTDLETLGRIKHVYEKYGYIAEPHTAVGFLGIDHQYENFGFEDEPGLVLSTAHPAKFGDVIEQAIDKAPDMPDRLAACFEKPSNAVAMKNDYTDFKAYLHEIE